MRGLVIALSFAALALSGCGGDNDSEPAAEDPLSVKTEADNSCDAKGINDEQAKEGTCERDGKTYTIVNRRTTLKLAGFTAKLAKVRRLSAVQEQFEDAPLEARGEFVILTTKVTNTMNAPLDFQRGLDYRVGLVIDGKTYAHNGGMAAYALGVQEEGKPDIGGPIQPDETRSLYLGWDLPKQVAKRVSARGSMLLVVPVELVTDTPLQDLEALGAIRIWK